ncbi:hypothetical protein Tco_0507126, partial [Tanacetum coccineum]
MLPFRCVVPIFGGVTDENDIEGVSETVFGDQDDPLVQELNQNSLLNEKEISSDPFNLYNLINKRDKGEENTGLDSSLHFPPGFYDGR